MTTSSSQHVILFYKYVAVSHVDVQVKEHTQFCEALQVYGRVLLSTEGINATLSGSGDAIEAYVSMMIVHPIFKMTRDDFKFSISSRQTPLFPELNIRQVDEIVSTGHRVPIPSNADRGYFTPAQFHKALSDYDAENTILLDVRNHKEFIVGHFENAVDPRVKTFSEYVSFLEKKVPEMKNKQVLMYCTGGIRCEKASDFLKSKGVEKVNHLQGGIHKYLQAFPQGGFFQGKNFVFDKRVVMSSTEKENQADHPASDRPGAGFEAEADRPESDCPEAGSQAVHPESINVVKVGNQNDSCPTLQVQQSQRVIVGKCIECQTPYEEFTGKNVCTVCRDCVLVCANCVQKLRGEFHCDFHQYLKRCYFTFVQYYPREELMIHLRALQGILSHEALNPAWKKKRKMLRRQISKVTMRIETLNDDRTVQVESRTDGHFPCRTCFKSQCPGTCWGFWTESSENEASSCLP